MGKSLEIRPILEIARLKAFISKTPFVVWAVMPCVL
jgi:hypothetical protein